MSPEPLDEHAGKATLSMSANMIADEVRRLCITIANANVPLLRRPLTPSARMSVGRSSARSMSADAVSRGRAKGLVVCLQRHMSSSPKLEVRVALLLTALAGWQGCSAGAGGDGAGGSSTGGSSTGGSAMGGTASRGDGGARAGTGGTSAATGGVTGAAGDVAGASGTGAGGAVAGGSGQAGGTAGGKGGSTGTAGHLGGSGGAAGIGGSGGLTATTGSGGAAGGANGCDLPATVSFQRDVQPFLIKSCGSTGSDGCHVIDAASTMSSGGWDHAYDWITAGAHASSCPEKPTPLRFQVVIAVIDQANPPTCSKSRQMPPPNATGDGLRAPLTSCQVAMLQTWLDEPLVTQMHRADDSSPTTPYPMPPFN